MTLTKYQRSRSQHVGILEKIKQTIFSPSSFFESVKSEGLMTSFTYFCILSFLSLMGNIVFSILSSSVSPLGSLFGKIIGFFAIAFGIGIWIVVIILSLVFAGFLHVAVKLLGGRNGYTNTYKAFAYSFTPALLGGWIPLVGIFLAFYSIYLQVKGISVLQKFSMFRAFCALILGLIVFVAVLIFFFAFLGSLYTQPLGGFADLSPGTPTP